MKPEKILQSDMLDIIFEDRNKDYGAYELRRSYNGRITKALGLTAMVVFAFGLMQSFKVPHRNGKIVELEVKAELDISKFQEDKKEVEKPKEEVKRKTATPIVPPPTKQFTSVFKMEKDPPPVATQDDLENNAIGKMTNDVPGKSPIDVYDPPPPGPPSSGTDDVKKEEEVNAGPIMIAQQMPEFPGGKEALVKFMQRNLHQPDDFEEGQKMTVIARFVVDTEGNIVNLEIAQNGRKDLDAEVLRVIKKMPQWKPGMQNGRKVAVYFKVPVTFVSPD